MLAKICFLAVILGLANGHGYLKFPLARTSIHRSDEFNPVYNPPYWYDDSGVWCGNVQQDARYSTCGRCGDRQGETTANQNGIYDKKVITATFQSGSVIEVIADLGAPHYGHYFLELCAQETETDNCFQRLAIVGGSRPVRDGNRVCTSNGDGDTPHEVTARVQLPAGFRCNRCTLRWTYRTSYPYWAPGSGQDFCDNPNPAQTFRNCADIKIV